MNILQLHIQGNAVGYYRHWLPARAINNLDDHSATYWGNDLSAFEAINDLYGDPSRWLMQNGPTFDVVHMGFSNSQPQVTAMQALRNYLRVEHEKNVPLLVDIDDDIYNVPTYNTSFKGYTPEAESRKITLIQMRAADGLTTSTTDLQSVITRQGDAKNIVTLDNYCNPGDWPNELCDPRRSDDKSVRILFAGGQGRKGDIEPRLAETIHNIMRKYDGKDGRPFVRLFFLGCTPEFAVPYMPDSLNPNNNRCFYLHPCRLQTYWKLIKYIQPDILWAPVEHNTFNESKSCIKAYDAAMSPGTAFICEKWPTYAPVPDEACVRAGNEKDWQEGLEGLIENSGERLRLNKRLREWVFDSRQIDQHISKWIAYYEECIQRPVVQQLSDVIRPRIIRPE